MKRDLCTNPILASQLPHTAVSMYPQTQKPGCNTCMYAALFVTLHFNLVLKCDLRHTALLCLHLFPHLFAIAFLSRPSSPQPHLPFSSPSPSPIHYYPYTFIWYSCSPPPIIPSVFFTSVSVVPPLSNAADIPYWCLQWGMGGPVLPTDFNELLWGSDQRHQKQHSVTQPARFNASLLTTVFSLNVMKAPPAGRDGLKTHVIGYLMEEVCRESGKSHEWD